jgi:signal transduction histidine kinase/CheY-like chemotaxis protein
MAQIAVVSHLLARATALTLLYVLAAEVGLTVAFVNHTISPVWPPTGVAVAALTLWGPRWWPAITLGAFWANTAIDQPAVVALSIAFGNTLEAVLGGMLLRRLGIRGELTGPRDAVAVLAIAAVVPLPSATGGVVTLALAGVLPWSQFALAYLVWWVGDAMGVLLLVPVVVGWLGQPARTETPAWLGELVAVLGVVAAATLFAFRGAGLWSQMDLTHMPVSLFTFPPLLWGALRLPPRGSTLALAVMAGLAAWYTVQGLGPFADADVIQALVLLELTLAGMAGTLLVLIGAMAERARTLDALAAAKRRADDASRAKSRFLAAASHDLRQPLQAMSLILGVLYSRLRDAPLRQMVSQLQTSLDAMVELFNALLDLFKFEMAAVEVQRGPVPVGILLQRLDIDFAGMARAKGLDLRIVPSAVTLWSDAALLERILRNLVSNAIRYTDHGRVLVGCRRSGTLERFEVWDTGCGIPEEQLATIFEEFHQLGNPARARAEGHGLGLAIAQRAADLLGHRLDVCSTLGRGSRFSIAVPLAPPAPSAWAPEPVETEPERARSGGVVLVIEDDPLILAAMRLVLADLRCTMLAATSVADAVALITTSPPPDLVIADYRLPGGETGVEALTAVRARLGANLPVCVITGDLSPEIQARVEAMGGQFLHKPIRAEAMTALVEAAFRCGEADQGAGGDGFAANG